MKRVTIISNCVRDCMLSRNNIKLYYINEDKRNFIELIL